MSKSDRERCHGCNAWVYIAPSADTFRRVLCARCKAGEPEDVEDLPDEDKVLDGLEHDHSKFPQPGRLPRLKD